MSRASLEWHDFLSFINARKFEWEKPCVYMIVSQDERILYVGSSKNGFGDRYWGQEGILQAFEDGAPKKIRIAVVSIDEMSSIESQLIADLDPVYNKAGKLKANDHEPIKAIS